MKDDLVQIFKEFHANAKPSFLGLSTCVHAHHQVTQDRSKVFVTIFKSLEMG